MLLTAANDGMLGVWDLRKPELYAMSDSFEEDLSTIAIMKNGKKVATATQGGIINIFSWDWFGDCSDRIIGHPSSIDTMVKYDENTLITGCEDGLIRAVSVLPNRIVAVLGDPLEDEGENDGFHIQKVTLSHDKYLLASVSLDDIVKVIDVSNLADLHKSTGFDEAAYEQSIQHNLKENHGKIVK